jgi:hypothetical protein
MKKELSLGRELGYGSEGPDVKRLQEWLNLNGYGLGIDGDFGRVTEDAVRRFQKEKRMKQTGKVNQRTFSALVAPMSAVLAKPVRKPKSLGTAILTYAKAHLAQQPREVGGPNRGPWVRLYTGGNEGEHWAWCAGFVSFVLKQACELMGTPMPIAGSVGCDQLASQAKAKNLFIAEQYARERLSPGSLFLVRKSPTDWTHTGIVAEIHPEFFRTIEGNTNDDGVREGYEVCTLTRSYTSKDFVLL